MQLWVVVLAYVGAQVALVAQEVSLHTSESKHKGKSIIVVTLCVKEKGGNAKRAICHCTEIPLQF